MANKILVVVDMQEDFVRGSLGSPAAEKIVNSVMEKVKNFDGKVIFTQDTHEKNYLDTQEGKHLPVLHCIKGTEGWEIIEELKPLLSEKKAEVYEKITFGSDKLARRLLDIDREEKIESITLIGLCTDICVVSNALLIKAFLPETPIIVDTACCAGVTEEKHRSALETMRSCQIEVISDENL